MSGEKIESEKFDFYPYDGVPCLITKVEGYI